MSDQIRDESGYTFLILQHEIIDSEIFDDAIEKMVYIVLKRHANQSGNNSFPSALTISKKASCSSKTVYRKIDSLIAKKLISKQARFREDGSKSSNIYTIHAWDTESYGVRTQSPMGTDTESHKRYSFNDNHLEDDDANADFEKQVQKMQGAGLHFMNNSANILKLASFYNNLDRGLFHRLIDIAIEKKPTKIDYLNSIVTNWKKNNIDTVEKAVAESEARKKKQAPSKDEDFDKLRQMFGG